VELYNPALGVLLLAILLVSAGLLLLAFALSLGGKELKAWRTVKVWAAGAPVYATIVLLTSMLPRTSPMKAALPYCDDDLCMTVLNVSQTATPNQIRQRFDIRLSS